VRHGLLLFLTGLLGVAPPARVAGQFPLPKAAINPPDPPVIAPARPLDRGAPMLTENSIIRCIDRDLRGLEPDQRHGIRYFTLAHLWNGEIGRSKPDPDRSLRTSRRALSKVLNSLSWRPRVVPPVQLDVEGETHGTIYRIALEDYGWDRGIWERLVAVYPYGLVLKTPEARRVYDDTHCVLPYLRADWFVVAASRPPLYEFILGLPSTEEALETRLLNLNCQENIREKAVLRAGFRNSRVSRNNRLLERHALPDGGYYWKSYDFAGNQGRQDLFAHPLGPGPDYADFRRDGGEILFSLPNKLQAYMLVNSEGRRIAEAPVAIVWDYNRQGPVVNGISCLQCHESGLQLRKGGEIPDHVVRDSEAFGKAAAEEVLALYPTAAKEDRFLKTLQQDVRTFQRALLDAYQERPPAAEGNQSLAQEVGEPISAVVDLYEGRLDPSQAAAEAGIAPDAFAKLFRQHFPARTLDHLLLARTLGQVSLLDQQSPTERCKVHREEFAASFARLIEVWNKSLPGEGRLTQGRPLYPPNDEPTNTGAGAIAGGDRPPSHEPARERSLSTTAVLTLAFPLLVMSLGIVLLVLRVSNRAAPPRGIA
jgi:hypothetical protein